MISYFLQWTLYAAIYSMVERLDNKSTGKHEYDEATQDIYFSKAFVIYLENYIYYEQFRFSQQNLKQSFLQSNLVLELVKIYQDWSEFVRFIRIYQNWSGFIRFSQVHQNWTGMIRVS